ncbi:acyltransferase family protein [Rheinheimera gaetbuli]
MDGLRALAVVPVLLFHAGFSWLPGGYTGVDIFFVISGYLITGILLNDIQQQRFSMLSFYERRARRILPALFAVVLCCLPLAWFSLLPADMVSFSQSLVALSGFVSNVFFWSERGYFGTATELKPLVHTWSLAIEEQYYLLFPLLLLLLVNRDAPY